jgi:peptidyl-prolyl cis-trans isomerase B (cyclophilin B)
MTQQPPSGATPQRKRNMTPKLLIQAIQSHRRFGIAPLVAAALAACGGGGGGGGGPVGPEPTVTAMAINPKSADLRTLMVTITGANLASGLGVTSPQCTSLTRSTTAPNASDAATAYYQCNTAAATGSTVTVTAARSSDGGSLGAASITLGAATTVAEAIAGEGAQPDRGPGQPAVAGTAKYSQLMTVTVTGTNVNQGLDVSSVSCSGMALSTSPPLVSNASTAYYRCKADSANNLAQVTITPTSDPTVLLANPPFNVALPQVTLKMKLDVVPLGEVVITMDPNVTPITVDNFLAYVNAGFYNNTIFHDNVSNTPVPGGPSTRFILQGGGYGPTSGLPRPTPKATNAPIALEAMRSNVQWSVAMAREAANAATATSQFFINLVDNSGLLDATPGTPGTGYAVFGDVSAGTSIVDAMAAAACTSTPDFICLPTPNVIIESAVQTR